MGRVRTSLSLVAKFLIATGISVRCSVFLSGDVAVNALCMMVGRLIDGVAPSVRGRRSQPTCCYLSGSTGLLPRWLHSGGVILWWLLALQPLLETPSSCMARTVNWPLQRTANISGDIMLGAFFPIHEANSSYECGRIQIEVCKLLVKM